MGHGSMAARRSLGPPWCGSSRPFCGKTPAAMFSSPPSRKSASRSRTRLSSPCEMTVARPRRKQLLRFLTNAGDWIEAGRGHPIRFEKAAASGIKPYIHVRGDLWALLTRAVFLDLAGLGEIREHEGRRCFGVASAEEFFPMARAEEAEAIETDDTKAAHES